MHSTNKSLHGQAMKSQVQDNQIFQPNLATVTDMAVSSFSFSVFGRVRFNPRTSSIRGQVNKQLGCPHGNSKIAVLYVSSQRGGNMSEKHHKGDKNFLSEVEQNQKDVCM